MNDGRSFGLDADADSGTGQFGSFQRHKADVRGVEDLDHAGVHPLFFDAGFDIGKYVVQRNPADGLFDLTLKCGADSDHDFFRIASLRGFWISGVVGLFRVDAVSSRHGRNRGGSGSGCTVRRADACDLHCAAAFRS